MSTDILDSMIIETPVTASMDGGSSTVFASGSDLEESNPKTECSKKILNIRQSMSVIRLKATKTLIEALNISSSLVISVNGAST